MLVILRVQKVKGKVKGKVKVKVKCSCRYAPMDMVCSSSTQKKEIQKRERGRGQYTSLYNETLRGSLYEASVASKQIPWHRRKRMWWVPEEKIQGGR